MAELPTFYSRADRSATLCRIEGCDELRVRGISVCPFHEHMFDTGDWPSGLAGWNQFLRDAASPRKDAD